MAYTEETGRDPVCSWREHRNAARPGNEKRHDKVMNPLVAASRRPRVMTSVVRIVSLRNQGTWPDCNIGKGLQDGTVEGGERAGLAPSEFDKERIVDGDARCDGSKERTLEQGSG